MTATKTGIRLMSLEIESMLFSASPWYCLCWITMRMGDGCIDGTAWHRFRKIPFLLKFVLIMSGIAVGMNKGHVVRKRELPPRPSRRKGILSQKTKAVRSLIKEVCG